MPLANALPPNPTGCTDLRDTLRCTNSAIRNCCLHSRNQPWCVGIHVLGQTWRVSVHNDDRTLSSSLARVTNRAANIDQTHKNAVEPRQKKNVHTLPADQFVDQSSSVITRRNSMCWHSAPSTFSTLILAHATSVAPLVSVILPTK